MATLGEAFIAVRADMSPFRKGLEGEVKKAADKIEKDLGKAVKDGIEHAAESAGKAGGDKAGKGLRDGIKRHTGNKDQSPWVDLVGALGAALDDGISALPTELKAAIVLGIIVAAPIVSAALAGAIATGIAAGVLGLGVALGTQFDSVQDRWTDFILGARRLLVLVAGPFENALLSAIEQAEDRLREWTTMLAQIFDQVALYLDPVVTAILDAIEYFLDALNEGLGDSDAFFTALVDSIYIIGEALAEIAAIFLATGEDGANAFRDLVYVLASMAVALADAIAMAATLYGALRKFVQDVPAWLLAIQPLLLLFRLMADEADGFSGVISRGILTNNEYSSAIRGVISNTKEEEKALKELEKAIKDANDAAWASINVNIAWERSLDDLQEGFKRNGKTIAIETEEGRRNLENLGDAIKAAQERATERYKRGELDSRAAHELYAQELEAVYRIAESFGVSRAEVKKFYEDILLLSTVPPPDIGWTAEMARNARAARDALRQAWNLDPNRLGGPQTFADGGIVRSPTNALIGEAGSEVVIPMTKPARAAELMRQSGLDRMLGTAGDVMVSVYLGNEAFDQHVQKIVVQDNRSQARSLNYGAR